MPRISAPATLLSAILLTAGVATLHVGSKRSALVVVAIAIGAVALSRPRARWLAARLGLALLGIAALVAPFALAGEIARAFAIGIRALAAATIALSLVSTLSLVELPAALRGLGAPESLAATIHALLWQFENVTREGRRLSLARRLRGATRALAPEVLSLLLVRTAARAERVDLALRLRGATTPDLAQNARFRASDAPALLAALGLAVGLHFVI